MVLVAVTFAGARRLAWREVLGVDANATREPKERLAARLLGASGLLVACYCGVVIVSRLFADPGIPFDERIFAPVFLLLATMVATGAALWWTSTSSVLPRIALFGALLAWWLAAGSVTQDEAQYALDVGSDFAGEAWRRSELLDWARTEGASHPLYTNWPAVLYFYVHRASRDVPLRTESARMAAFVDTVRAHDGRIIEFSAPGPEYVTVDSLRRAAGLRVIAEHEDGVVLAPVK